MQHGKTDWTNKTPFHSGNRSLDGRLVHAMKLQAIRMPYFYFDLVIGEEFKDQGGMILEDTDIAFDKADCLATPGGCSTWWGLFAKDQRFDDPITVPGRKPLVTLRDAALYITKLPKAEHDAEEWQTAMEALLLVAENAARERRTKPPKARSGK
jgi:hypothetical protein